jgi:arylsulfatase A-like enzyme
VRTDHHKLIYFWRKDQWECYDLIKDPAELHNIYQEPSAARVVAELKKELARLKDAVGDQANRFAEAVDWPKSTADVTGRNQFRKH